MINATEANVKWLIERLYCTKRLLESSGVQSPVFVLLTRGVEDRLRVESIFYKYFDAKYGTGLMKHFAPCASDGQASIFELSELGARIVLMDV